MNDMSAEELETLRDDVARCVMGWTLAPHKWAYNAVAQVWHDQNEVPLLTRTSWRPDENDTQNMKVLDRMTALGFGYVIRTQAQGVVVNFSLNGLDERKKSHPNRRVALLLSALHAVGAVDA